MPLWSANDDPTGKPNWSNTADVYGVNATEARVKGASVSPGWVRVVVGTGSAQLTLVSGGYGYSNSDVITVDSVGTAGSVNATANVIVGLSANLSGVTLAVTSGQANAVATGTSLLTLFSNGATLAVYTNTTAPQVVRVNQVANATFMNISSTWAATNATSTFAFGGVIQQVVPNNGGGSGFKTTSNVAFTTSNGQNASVTAVLSGRAGRTTYENMVIVRNMQNDASDDTVFPDA